MLFELKSVFQNDGEEKQVEYNLDLSGLDVDGVYPFKTPVVVTAKATNRASLITLVINAHFDYSRDCDRCGEPYVPPSVERTVPANDEAAVSWNRVCGL